MKYAIATKQKMTQLFDENGRVYPVTILSINDLVVTQIKTTDKDGYNATQFGFGSKKANNISKSVISHTKRQGQKTGFAFLKEVQGLSSTLSVGENIPFDLASGDIVQISGETKAKGFQGVVKRYNFKGGPRSHGQKHSERERGSSGAGGYQRVFKGTRMAGRMGGDNMTFKGVQIISIDADKKLIYVKGAVPGRRGTNLEITQR